MKFGTREILFLIVMLALLGSAWYFVFKKADERIEALNADTAIKNHKLQELRSASVRIADMTRKTVELQDQIKDFESKLPRHKDVEQIVEKVTRQAVIERLEVAKMQTMQSEKMSGFSEQQVKLIIKGNFRSFYKFLIEIERLERITRVNQMRLTKINETDGSMNADMTLSIFYQPDSGSGR